MSSTIGETVTEAHEIPHEEEHAHPSDWAYIKVAVFLAVLTGIEVFTYFESVLDWGDALIPSLIVLMVIKFYTVVGWFMHLKFDSQLFTRFFVSGLVLAIGVYIAMLLTFQFWG
jgi:cytochrome c oxidase subunit 4